VHLKFNPSFTKSYTIAFTIRSGSNLLCDVLSKNGFGHPSEYFQPPFGVVNAHLYQALNVAPDDFPGFVDRLTTVKAQHGVFGSKVTWDQKNALVDRLASTYDPTIDVLDDFYPNHAWIYLRRRDRFGQAISAWTAQETGVWSSDTAKREIALEYDFFAIFTVFFSLLVEDHMWENYFAQSAHPPIRIWYEDFVDAPSGTLERIARLLHERWKVDPPKVDQLIVGSRLKKQADARSAAFAARFEEDLGRIGAANHWRGREKELGNWLEFFQRRRWNDDRRNRKPDAAETEAATETIAAVGA
jgi:LPS sulfotransferase NodH